jgi:hypothetical protein
MKAKALPVLFAFALATLRGGEAELPKFDSNVIGHPPLSLSEKLNTLPRTFDHSGRNPDNFSNGLLDSFTRPTRARIAPPAPRFTPKTGPWKMPILEPNPNVDHKIVLKEPDPNLDPKMVKGVTGLEAKPAKSPGAP